MKRAVIFMFLICLILLINFIHLIPIISAQSSAQSIEVDYPDEVNQNEEFSFKIKLVDFKEGIYDVKIDLISESGARIAKILNNDKWSSTYYYITEAIESDKKETFKMKAEDYTGKAGFEIKIRSSSGIVKTFPDYEIEIVKNNKVKEEKENNNEINDKKDESNEISSKIAGTNAINKLNENNNYETKIVYLNSLNPQNIKSSKNVEVKDKSKNYSFYGLILFSILILLLFVLKILSTRMLRKNGIA